MSSSVRVARFLSGLQVLSVALLLAVCWSASAQSVPITTPSGSSTAPQLLPYTAKLLAGGAANPATFTVGATCPQAGAPNLALDKYGDGCLATEVQLVATYGGPRYAAVDTYGNVFFGDYSAGLVRRIDAVTGIITAVAGSATATTPAKGAACTTGSAVLSADAFGDGCLSTQVKLGRPGGIAFDPSGNLYFADTYGYSVREVAATSGFVGYTTINNSGAKYTTAPTVTFSSPPTGGTTATGTATISTTGVVLSILMTNPGSGYTTAPTITLTAAPSGGTTATATAVLYSSGVPPAGGTISLIDGGGGGAKSSYGYESNNGSLTSCTQAGAVCINAATQGYLDGPSGIAFDPSGNLYIADYYDTAVVVVNTSSVENTVTGVGIPAGTVSKIMGAPNTANTLAANGVSGTTVCTNGSSCGYTQVFLTGTANATETDYPFGVTYDLSGNVYYASEYFYNIAMISSSGALTNFAGTPGSRGTNPTNITPASRGLATAVAIGSSYGVAADTYPSANVYIPDSTNGFIWRVDGTGKNMYVIGGGGGGVCATATDTFGDGCPGSQATFSASGGNGTSSASAQSGVYGIYVDSYADLFIGDQKNNLVRELASGTQFGVVGANQPVQTIEIHFSPGDVTSTASYTLTSNPTNFSLGKVVCKATNSDGSTDCIMPITATPPATYGYFSSNLQITSTDGTNNFLLSGIFEPSPKTRTSLVVSNTACSGTTYSDTLPTTLTVSLVWNGPTAPNGVYNFYVNGNTTPLNPTPIAVTNLNPSGASAYGAVYTYTFATPGTYSIVAIYTGDTYYLTSQSASTTITSVAPTYTFASTGFQEGTVTAGQTALYSFIVNQTGYIGTISFTVTGLPANTTYTMSPTSFTGVGCSITNTVTLNIITQKLTTVQPASFGGTGHGRWQLLSIVTGLGLALVVGLRRRRVSMRFGQLMMALALLLAASGTLACGKAVGTVLQPATPTGSYPVIVSAVSYSGSTLVGSSQVPITLIVQ